MSTETQDTAGEGAELRGVHDCKRTLIHHASQIGLCGYRPKPSHGIMEEMEAQVGDLIFAARREAMIECAKELCSLCHGGTQLHWSGAGSAYHSATNVVFCKAQPIHELIKKEDEA